MKGKFIMQNKEYKSRLRKIREMKGMSRRQLEQISGVSQSGIASYENDEKDLESASFKTILKLAKALNVKIKDITGEE